MKRVLFLALALLIGIVLPLQQTQGRSTPWGINPIDLDPGDDHPWGGDESDPGGVRINPGGDYGYINMSIANRISTVMLPFVAKLYMRFIGGSFTISKHPPVAAPSTPAPSRTVVMSGGK